MLAKRVVRAELSVWNVERMMRGLLVCCVMLAAGCSTSAAKPTFDLAGMKPTADGDAATLTGWFKLEGHSFQLYPTMTRPGANDACVSGVLLSLAGVPRAEDSDRPMTVSAFVYDAKDDAAEGAPNPCHSAVIVEAIEVSVPDA